MRRVVRVASTKSSRRSCPNASTPRSLGPAPVAEGERARRARPWDPPRKGAGQLRRRCRYPRGEERPTRWTRRHHDRGHPGRRPAELLGMPLCRPLWAVERFAKETANFTQEETWRSRLFLRSSLLQGGPPQVHRCLAVAVRSSRANCKAMRHAKGGTVILPKSPGSQHRRIGSFRPRLEVIDLRILMQHDKA